MSIIIDPESVYEPFNNLSLDQLRAEVGKMLKNGITIRCNDGKDDIILRSVYLVKSGAFKDIYLLDLLSISNTVYNSHDYILKIRFTANTPEYWNNEKSILPNQGIIPIVMSEGKRYEMIDGEIKKYFAEILPTKSHILLNTQNFIVDFIIQERMDMSLDFVRKHYQLPIDMIKYVMNNLLDIASNISSKGYTFTNFSPTSVMLKFSIDRVIFKLVNTSFIQRDDMVRIDGHRKLYSTASIAQMTSSNELPKMTMLINIIYTCFDLYQPYSLADKINSTCCKDSADFSCLLQHLISARNKQVVYYAKEDNVFADVVKVIQTGSDVNTIYSNLMTLIPVNPEIEKQFVNTVYDAVTSVVTFEQPASEYWNSNAFVYNCDMDNVTSDNLSATAPKSSYTGVGNLFNPASEDEPISLKPILSGSKTATTSRKSGPVKSSYTGVGNLFNTADEDEPISLKPILSSSTTTSRKSGPVKSSYTGVGNLFNTADEEDEPISLKPILSGSKTATTTAPKSSYTGVGNLFNTGSTTTSTAPKSSYTGVGNLFNTGSTTSTAPKSSYTGVGNLFNTASEDDEPISLKPILSGSKTATTTSTAPKSSYTGVGNLFNTASEDDEPISLKPILSGSKTATTTAPKSSYSVGNLFNNADEDEPETSESMFDYLNKRIDNLQDDVNQKFDTILERLD